MPGVPGMRREPASATWEAFGTTVVLRSTDASAIADVRAAVQRELDAIDRACSRFRADSELSRVNGAAGRSTRVSPLLIEALEVALRAAELTGGDVDPTVGRSIELAGYDRDWRLLAAAPAGAGERGRRAPSAQAIVARMRAGWRGIAVDRTSSSVSIPRGVRLDLGATAKAWAADRGARVGADAGGCGVLLSIGGDIATCGPAPEAGWRILVTDDHRSGHSAPGQTISIRCGGLATSSTAVRRWGRRGRSMHHIIDPRTGEPVRATWRTVSVAAANCTDANIAATAALVRAGEAPQWLASLCLPARLLDWEGGVTTIDNWPAEDALEQALR
ncbi:MAG: FAD:protein transferase [Solirubrobacterales bacterium]|nr:FAD:protein transferase [Solirubrobacterales bacterium]